MKNKFGELLLLLTAIFWGLGYIGVDVLVAKGMSSTTIIFTRFLIAAIVLIIIFYKKVKVNKEAIVGSMITGIVLFLAFMFQTIAINYTTITNISFLTSVNIVFVPILSFILLGKKIKVQHILSIILTLIGIWILTGGMSQINKGDILTLICAFFFGMHMVMIAYYSKTVEIYTLAIGQMLVTSLLGFLAALIYNVPIVDEVNNTSLLILLFVGLVPSALCFLFQNIGLKQMDESKGSIILSTEALWGVLFSVLLLGEKVTVFVLIGGLLMFLAVFIDEINFKKNKK